MNNSRITGIEKPAGLLMKLVFWIFRRNYGKVITPAKVVYARYPPLLFVTKKLYDVQASMKETSPELKLLIQLLVATLNGCDFCIDMSMRKAMDNKLNLKKFTQVTNFEQVPDFSDAEKAALAYVAQSTRHVGVPDEVFNNLRTCWNEKAIIEITFVAAAENYLNRMTKPLGIGADGFCMV